VLIARSVTHPKTLSSHARHDRQGLLPVPLTASPSSVPPPAAAGPDPSSSSAAAAGPAVLQVPVSVDLSSGMPQTISLTATGYGWVAWRIKPGGPDLDFSATHGVLQAGQTATVTVSLDVTQDGATVQTFDVNGQPVTATLQDPDTAATATDSPSPVSTDEVPSPDPSET
jgi:hypothetical protein